MVQIQNEYWHTEEKCNPNITKGGRELRYKNQGVELLYFRHIMTFRVLDVLDILSRNIRALLCKTSSFIS